MEALQDQFARAVESFLAETGMTPTDFGRAAAKDPRFVFDLREGKRAVTMRLADRVRDFMRRHQATHQETGTGD